MTHPFQAGDFVNGYLRDSGGNEQDLSVPQQEKFLREFCAQNELILVHVFKDVAKVASTTVGRENFDRMLDHFLKQKAPEKGLIIWSYARFARNDIDATIYKSQLRKAGYAVYSLMDKVPDGQWGRLIEYVIDVQNAVFLENLSKEVKRGQHHLVEQYGGVPGTPPRGFKREKLELGKRRNGQPHIVHRWEPRRDEEWERCRLAWELRAQGASIDEVRQRTRLYKSNNGYHAFYRNKIYLGILEFGQLSIPDYCEALITEETWNLVQEVNARHQMTNILKDGAAVNHPNRRRGEYLLTGLVRCGHCGSAMNGNTVMRAGRVKYSYYMCSRAKRRKDCPTPRIPREGLEEAILNSLLEHVVHPESLAELHAEEASLRVERQRYQADELETLRQQLAGIQSQVNRIVDAIARVSLTDALETKYQELEKQRLELQAHINKIAARAVAPPQPVHEMDLEHLAAQLRDIFTGADLNLKREILQSFVSKISVHRQGNEVRAYLEYVPPTLNGTPPDRAGGVGEGELCPMECPHGETTPGHKSLMVVYRVGPPHQRRRSGGILPSN